MLTKKNNVALAVGRSYQIDDVVFC